MGGSGGGFFGDKQTSPEDLAQRLKKSEIGAQNQQYEAEVNEIIGSLLKSINNPDAAELHKGHLETIAKAIEKDIEGKIDLLYGGSVAKHTYVDGLSDVDSLVLLNKSELSNLDPEGVKEYLFDRLKERLPQTDIEKGKLAVTVKFKDAEIQLLPALKYKSGYRIADETGKNWSFIKPKEFAGLLTGANQKNSGKLVPVIKLVKSINSSLPENRQMKSYHIEALAVEVFKDYSGAKTPKAMFAHFFQRAPEKVMAPIADRTGQSTHVDDYLGSANSTSRKIVADTLGRIGRRIQKADGACMAHHWKEILGT